MSLPSDELVATLNAVDLLLTIVGVLLLFQRQHRYDWRGWLGLVFIVVGTVCQIMANRV
jgi:drug/metabolite transporter (DMT)-like permease